MRRMSDVPHTHTFWSTGKNVPSIGGGERQEFFDEDICKKWIPCGMWDMTANHWWHHHVCRTEKMIQRTGEDAEMLRCNPSGSPFYWIFGLDLLVNPFWLHLAVQRQRSISRGKWKNNCAAQRQLWSIHLDRLWVAARGWNYVLPERKQWTNSDSQQKCSVRSRR